MPIDRTFGGVPERFREQGVRVHGNQFIHEGDMVEAIRTVAGVIAKGTRHRVIKLMITPRPAERGFVKRLVLDGFADDFNPQRFRKVE